MKPVPGVNYGALPFREQVAYFRRKLNLPTNGWTDIWQDAHDHAFVVAGANRDDLLADLRDAIDSAITNGTTLEQFRKDFDQIIAKYGWSYNGSRGWRTRVIYDTNLRTSYAAGRYAQLKSNTDAFPYWQYKHSHLDRVPRVMHVTPPPEGLNGLVLRHDDPFWNVYYPPNGWGCTCYVTGVSAGKLAQLGKDGPDTAPEIQYKTVTVGTRSPVQRTVQVADGTDPGFSYAPGRDAWLQQLADTAQQNADAQTKYEWTPQINKTAADYGLPEKLAFTKPPVSLGPPLKDATEITAALTDLIGGNVKVFDVHDVPVIIDASVLGRHLDPARSEYLPLLIDTLTDPQEVWFQLEQESTTQNYRMRVRVLKAYDLGRGKVLLIVADEQDGTLVTWTILPTSDWKYINRQRQGILIWPGNS